ncbi:trophoblast glycoprotein b [Oreochromis aureus]|uniref:trophoblast glycoprotein b n=1 Tax=Oreochromis aureus TaxID=47969 RepID=UPI0012BBB627|nr:trophoblast glycoprotein b [Oreochromis aureus]
MELELGAFFERINVGNSVRKTFLCSPHRGRTTKQGSHAWIVLKAISLRTLCAHWFSNSKRRMLSTLCDSDCGGTRGRLRKSGVMFLLFLLAIVPSGHGCPEECLCSLQTVKCQNKDLDKIPHFIPNNTKILFVSGNSISRISGDSFPTRLELLTDLHLSGNELEYVDTMAFNNLPNLVRLDLSNNTLQNFNESAFPNDTKLQHLNLSRSLHNHSTTDELLNFLRSGNLVNLTVLDLSNNDLVILPSDIFTHLSSLVSLSLQNTSIINIHNGTLKVPPLRELDLRNNSLKHLSSKMMAEFSLKPDLRIQLAGNPWLCNCFIEDTLMWLKNSTQVVDVQNLTCTNPKDLRHQPLLQLEKYELKCSMEMKGVLGTSYVFLGLVLALIGVIFLLVLYLNRKGIKRWMYNIRDACRDHMEGYHYRYEINSDPRLANLSINSDV